MVCLDSKVYNVAGSLFLFTVTTSCRLAEIRWFVCISAAQRSLCVSFSRTDSGLHIYHFFVWSNFNFLHNYLWIPFPTQSCMVPYSFWANLQHSHIIASLLLFYSSKSNELLLVLSNPAQSVSWLSHPQLNQYLD